MKAAAAMAAAANDNPLVAAPLARGPSEGADGTTGTETLPEAAGRLVETDGVHW